MDRMLHMDLTTRTSDQLFTAMDRNARVYTLVNRLLLTVYCVTGFPTSVFAECILTESMPGHTFGGVARRRFPGRVAWLENRS